MDKVRQTSDLGVTAYTPIASHAKNPKRLVIATGTDDESDKSGVHESDDWGENLTRLSGFTGVPLALSPTDLKAMPTSCMLKLHWLVPPHQQLSEG